MLTRRSRASANSFETSWTRGEPLQKPPSPPGYRSLACLWADRMLQATHQRVQAAVAGPESGTRTGSWAFQQSSKRFCRVCRPPELGGGSLQISGLGICPCMGQGETVNRTCSSGDTLGCLLTRRKVSTSLPCQSCWRLPASLHVMQAGSCRVRMRAVRRGCLPWQGHPAHCLPRSVT